MDLIDGMKAFVAVAEAGSFTTGADRLGISKKVASKYIQLLEKRLDTHLLNRTTRKLSLTDSGSRYLERCIKLLGDLEELETGLVDDEVLLSGLLRIAAPQNYGELFIAPLVAEFQKLYPKLSIDLRLSDRYIDLAEEGIDVSIRIGELKDSSLIARRLGQTAIWTFATPEYVKKYAALTTPDDLREHECVRDSNRKAGSAWSYKRDGKAYNIAVRGGILVNSAAAVRNIVLQGNSIGLAPDYIIAPDIKTGRLVRLLSAYSVTTLPIQAVYLRQRHLSPKVRAFIDYCLMSDEIIAGNISGR